MLLTFLYSYNIRGVIKYYINLFVFIVLSRISQLQLNLVGSLETKLPPKCICNSNKIHVFIEANAMNISAEFQLYPKYSF